MTRPPVPTGRGDAGSAFIESILAAAIVATALGGMYHVIGDGAGRNRGVEARRTALLIAQSELAAVGADIPLQPGTSAGLAGDMLWRVEISPYSGGGVALLKVAVSVGPRVGGASLVTLQSLRVGAGT